MTDDDGRVSIKIPEKFEGDKREWIIPEEGFRYLIRLAFETLPVPMGKREEILVKIAEKIFPPKS